MRGARSAVSGPRPLPLSPPTKVPLASFRTLALPVQANPPRRSNPSTWRLRSLLPLPAPAPPPELHVHVAQVSMGLCAESQREVQAPREHRGGHPTCRGAHWSEPEPAHHPERRFLCGACSGPGWGRTRAPGAGQSSWAPLAPKQTQHLPRPGWGEWPCCWASCMFGKESGPRAPPPFSREWTKEGHTPERWGGHGPRRLPTGSFKHTWKHVSHACLYRHLPHCSL